MNIDKRKGKPRAYPMEIKKQALEMFADKYAEIGKVKKNRLNM
jgi:hypothetical protein